MAKATVAALDSLIAKLRAERREHVAQIAAIDAAFGGLGIGADRPRRGPGRPKGSKQKVAKRKVRGKKKVRRKKKGSVPAAVGAKKKVRGKRRKFARSGEASVLAFVAARKNPTTAEVNKRWASEGRAGKADNTLSKLAKDGKLARIADPAVRGSRYTVK